MTSRVPTAKRFAAVWAGLVCGLGLALGAAADQTDPGLDALFAQLAETVDPAEVADLENRIQEIWLDSGSDSIAFLMERARQAMDDERYDEALVHLDNVVELAPKYAEGWNRRATLHYVMERYDQSILDIERTVALEPRHYAAWSGLGRIFLDIDDEEDAVKAFEKALTANPHLDDIKELVESLKPKVGGRPI